MRLFTTFLLAVLTSLLTLRLVLSAPTCGTEPTAGNEPPYYSMNLTRALLDIMWSAGQIIPFTTPGHNPLRATRLPSVPMDIEILSAQRLINAIDSATKGKELTGRIKLLLKDTIDFQAVVIHITRSEFELKKFKRLRNLKPPKELENTRKAMLHAIDEVINLIANPKTPPRPVPSNVILLHTPQYVAGLAEFMHRAGMLSTILQMDWSKIGDLRKRVDGEIGEMNNILTKILGKLNPEVVHRKLQEIVRAYTIIVTDLEGKPKKSYMERKPLVEKVIEDVQKTILGPTRTFLNFPSTNCQTMI